MISDYSWEFNYGGEKIKLEGDIVSFRFDESGEYEITLIVTDTAGNLDNDSIIIKVIGTGNVTGTGDWTRMEKELQMQRWK